MTPEQEAIVDRARAWAEREARVRALLLTGSLGRGAGDNLSDLDLVIVSQPGLRDELWTELRPITEQLGRPLGLFRDIPWPDPFIAIVLYDGPTKVDLFFRDGDVEPTPWLVSGFTVLVDKEEVEARLRRALASLDPTTAPDGFHADAFELDAHAWDFTWWLYAKLRRSERWLVYTRLALFVEVIVLGGLNAAAGEPWASATAVTERLDPETVVALEAALPRGTESEELLRSLRALVDLYAAARPDIARRFGVTLSDELMEQVRGRIMAGD